MHESLFMENLRKKVVEAVGRRMNRSEAAYLFEVGLSSLKHCARGWSLPASTKGKHNRRQEMRVVVLLYRAQLPPFSVKTHPWHIRVNRLAKPLE